MSAPAVRSGLSAVETDSRGRPMPWPVVVVELERERQHRAARVADRLLELEHGRVVLAELRIDGPGRVAVSSSIAAATGSPFCSNVARGLSSFSYAGRGLACRSAGAVHLEVAQGEVAVRRPARPALDQRRVGQRLEPHRA